MIYELSLKSSLPTILQSLSTYCIYFHTINKTSKRYFTKFCLFRLNSNIYKKKNINYSKNCKTENIKSFLLFSLKIVSKGKPKTSTAYFSL